MLKSLMLWKYLIVESLKKKPLRKTFQKLMILVDLANRLGQQILVIRSHPLRPPDPESRNFLCLQLDLYFQCYPEFLVLHFVPWILRPLCNLHVKHYGLQKCIYVHIYIYKAFSKGIDSIDRSINQSFNNRFGPTCISSVSYCSSNSDAARWSGISLHTCCTGATRKASCASSTSQTLWTLRSWHSKCAL